MDGTQQERPPLAQEIRDSGRHSPLFWWLVDRVDEFSSVPREQGIGWNTICKRLESEGVTDAQGKTPTAITARMTWWRVRKYLEKYPSQAQKALASPKPAPQPSSPPPARQAENWQPPATKTLANNGYKSADVTPPLVPKAADANSAKPFAPRPITDLSPEAQAKINRVLQQLQETDRKRAGL
jgi:hypothetical protein